MLRILYGSRRDLWERKYLFNIMRVNPVLISNQIRQQGIGQAFETRVMECLVADLVGIVLNEPTCEIAPLSALIAAKDMLVAYVEREEIKYCVGWEVPYLDKLYAVVYDDGHSKECVKAMPL